jgi:thiosulfate dehydrogenase
MSRRHMIAATLAAGLAAAPAPMATVAAQPGSAGGPTQAGAFRPPQQPPDGEFGDMIRFGEDVFVRTQDAAKDYVGNGLTCANCHVDRGRLVDSAPMWAAYVLYPQYRQKSRKVDTLEDRLRDCFRFSMNGRMPKPGTKQLVGLMSYFHWLASGAPVGAKMPGQGYPALAKPAEPPSRERGVKVYAASCALCHGEDGQGRKVGERYAFPPLWGPDSYNWGAGMHRVNTAAAFIKANMPLGRSGTLSDRDAWDVAAFVNSHPRPQDPRFAGDVAETREKYHDDNDFYGHEVDGVVLGSPESVPRL